MAKLKPFQKYQIKNLARFGKGKHSIYLNTLTSPLERARLI